MSTPYDSYDDGDERSFFQRNRMAIVPGVIVLGLVGTVLFKIVTSHSSGSYKPPEPLMVRLPPMPTPPPVATPPPPPPPPEQKETEQAIPDDDKKPEEPKDAPPPGITTNNTGGNGPDMGLQAGSSSNMIGGSGATRAGNLYGWYGGQVKKTILEALNKNPHLRTAAYQGDQYVWFNSTGRITRVKLSQSTGDPAVEKEIENTLTGIQMTELPPKGMGMLHLRITAERSGH